MATFYFNGAVDGEWTELGNWWTDAGLTTQATALPTSADDVIATAAITSNSSSAPTVANLTVDGVGANFGITGTVTGNATFNVGSITFAGTINGDCLFTGDAVNNGTVNGDCVFNDVAWIDGGTVNGNCVFNYSSWNSGTVTGNATFNNESYNTGTVTGNATFNNIARNGSLLNSVAAVVGGTATFNDTSYNEKSGLSSPIFNDYSHNEWGVFPYVTNPTFNDYSYNNAEVDYGSLATYNDYSENRAYYGTGYSTTFNHYSRNVSGTTQSRTISFNDASYGIYSDGGGQAIISGLPIRAVGFVVGSNDTLSFTRAQLGINGSSILGVL
jgi:hypothetical protein